MCPLGAFLSGGVDSSAVVALMAEAGRAPVKTFSIGFDEKKYDELQYARLVANRYATDHHEFVVRPERDRDFPEAGLALQRAVRRLVRDPHLLLVAADAAPRDRAL